MNFRRARILLLLALLLWLAADWSAQLAQRPTKQTAKRQPQKPTADDAAFTKTVLPFVAEHCAACHSAKAQSGGLDLSGFRTTADVAKHRDQWERVAERIANGEMPPKGMPRPDAAQSKAVTGWIEGLFARVDEEEAKKSGVNPGRVTARRLNRAEYNNTVRDLFGVAFQPADDFPADDSGYGFDNIGDVLSLSPLLMEKYLAAADKISHSVIPDFKPMKPVQERFNPGRADHKQLSAIKREKISDAEQIIALELTHDFPVTAEYDLRADLSGPVLPKDQPSVMIRIDLALDGRQINKTQLDRKREKPWLAGERVLVPAGRHTLRFVIIHDGLRPEDENPRNNKLGFNAIQIQGPFNQQPEPPSAGRKRLFVCGEENDDCARRILADLTHRAYRRPTGAAEIEPLVRLVKLAQSEGDTFAQSIRLALKAVLVSPHFLFRIERDTTVGAHRITDIELASRLSYFLWSSTPDEELLRLAESNRLHEPATLDAQVQRMMRDARLAGFIENFAGQWLQLRNLDSVKPDPDLFPAFTPELRAAMKTETERFFAAIIGEDRSVLDFIDGRFTFLNETLAKHYGITGIKGQEFRRVELDGRERSGVLTQGSVLTVSSYPTRTSPVIRGKWILENILNAPPPPPPANVPSLDEKDVGSAASLRQRLEQHRANAVCASCHAKMDPLGFGLENYDAIGRWRTRDGKFPLDTSGTLPNGKSFATPAELKTILLGDREAFARGLSEKLLTYALGRGLERYDRATVQTVSQKLASDGYKFSRLVKEVVASTPFQMRRGETGRLVSQASQ